MRQRSTVSALSLVLVLLTALCAAAGDPPKEKPYALIFGTVWDPDGHVIYGVKVKIRRAQEKKTRWELYSDHRGEFAQRVPAGEADYVVWADLKGYPALNGKHLQPGPEVTVHINNDERADIGVHLKW
jgi:hypothetical protein